MQLLLAGGAAHQATADLVRALDDGTLASALEQPYDLSAEEAAEACAAVRRALIDTWGNSGYHLTYEQWLADAQPALFHVLVDTAARAIDKPWTGGHDLRVLRHALGRIAADPRLLD
ncbi:hypothetical protein OG455_27785 [Kitasatospora sp. NBC_01287]|uniref:hypothetical protein n=1 Tax=Kitasatospora sp. NBC_01287 TaxID=2903573 RepID=UPI0022587EC4|nr:hypothetical protein [Kitasatospora sp. NBC_01287]MCX4749263.1 hypothetical protein [Kitasatospora sp. NBC_01287]